MHSTAKNFDNEGKKGYFFEGNEKAKLLTIIYLTFFRINQNQRSFCSTR
jgi:hypothetical protein